MKTNKKLLIAIVSVFALALLIPGMLFASSSKGEAQALPAAAAQTTATPAPASQPTVAADQLYMPRNVKTAFETYSTRSMDGNPGRNYFQTTAVHDITLTVAPPGRTVMGTEEITYTNNTPLVITHLPIRLYENAHLPNAVREQVYSKDFITDGVVIDEFRVNGEIVDWKPILDDKLLTVKIIELAKPLAAKESINLSFKWHYDLALDAQKGGVVDPTTFYLAYFFPRVSPMNDTDVDTLPFFDTEEYTYRAGRELFNDFANFNFEINVPKNYVVWATGDLLNPDEVLQPAYAKRLKDSLTSDQSTNIAQPEEIEQGKVTAQTDTVTWKWKAQNVPDIAIGLSDHFVWDAGSVVVDPATNRRASVQAAYPAEATNFKGMVEDVKKILTFGSTQWPGVPYPYSKAIVFVGGADEEYPMMANDAAEGPEGAGTRFVAAHELLHNYFPFYMGIDERRYPMFDEGWTTAFEYLFNVQDMGPEQAAAFMQTFRMNSLAKSRPGSDIPIITPADSTRGTITGFNAYQKPALAYLALKDYMGDAAFKKSLQEFINRWHGKHPLPWDMFNTFNNVSGQDLNWFWNNWFFTNNYIDLAVQGVNKTNNGYQVQVKNVGGFAIPFDVIAVYADGTQEKIHQNPGIWKHSPDTATVTLKSSQEPKAVTLDGGIFLDATAKDNTWGTLPPTPTPTP